MTGSGTAGYTVTNTHEIQRVDVSGEKTWNHGDNPVADRPAGITVFLHADVIKTSGPEVTDDPNEGEIVK